MTTFGDLRQWRAEPLRTASDQLRKDVRSMERARDAVDQKTVPASWTGLSQISGLARKVTLVSGLTAHMRGVASFERAVFSAADRVQKLSETVADIDTSAATKQLRVAADGAVHDDAPPTTHATAAEAREAADIRRHEMQAVAERVRAALAEALSIDSDLVGAVPRDSYSENADATDGLVNPAVADAWSRMSDAERRAALEDMAEEIAAEHGLEDFTFEFRDLEDEDGDGIDDDPGSNYHGYWRDSENLMVLDENDLADPHSMNTLAHELRHAQQHHLVDQTDVGWWDRLWGGKPDYSNLPDGVTQSDVEAWRENFKDYKSTSNGATWDEYLNQPVEVDARETGDAYVEGMTPEELARHAQEGR